MEKSNFQRMIFLFLTAFLLLIAVAWQPKVYGNDEASIRRYIHQTTDIWMQTQGDLLAVEDRNDDRIVIFRPDGKKPDELWFARFRKNADGNYEGYAPEKPRRIYSAHPGNGIWSEVLDDWSEDDPASYYAIWNENPRLAEISFSYNYGPEQRIPVTKVPALILFEFQKNCGSWERFDSAYFDANGNEIR